MLSHGCNSNSLNLEPTKSILATRTLTTLISTLESAPTILPTSRFEYRHRARTTSTGNNQGGPQELRISNAFATLLSRDRENATVASRVIQKQTNDTSVDLVVSFDVNPPELAMARGSRVADKKGPFKFLADSALRQPEKPYSLIESDHAGVDVSKGPHEFVKECL
jgi:hypothetical protein